MDLRWFEDFSIVKTKKGTQDTKVICSASRCLLDAFENFLSTFPESSAYAQLIAKAQLGVF
jgi:hypothetical protein